MKKNTKIFDYVLIGIISLLIILSLELHIFSYRPSIVLSGSMEPSIHTGSLIYYKKIKTDKVYETISEGAIITYKRSDGFAVTHQVIRIDKENDVIITKGIVGNASEDKPIKANQVKGVYAFSIPVLGFIISYLKNPFLLLGIVIIVALIILIPSLVKLIKDSKKSE